jgi:hypothetical protein
VQAPSQALRSFAEEPDPHIAEAPPPARRIITPRFVLSLSPSPTQSVTSCVRTTAAELDATIAEVRALARTHGLTGNVWQVGPSCEPAGLAGMLSERGFVPARRAHYEPHVTVMALTDAPPAVESPRIEARLCGNLDEYVQVIRVAMESFNESAEDTAAWLAAAPSFWASQDGVWRFTHIAYLDGRPAGFGFASSAPAGVLLGGSGVVPWARGQGVYRALLAARWAEAVKLNRPGLVVQAGAMSRPILERCGFQTLCRLEMLDDPGLVAG